MAKTAKKYKEVPYYHCGRNKETGLDCAGLVIQVFKDLGIEIEGDPGSYGRVVDSKVLVKTVKKNLSIVPEGIDGMRPGDILLMKFSDHPRHLAIYTGESIIHSYERAGKVEEHRLSDVWKKRIKGVYRYVRIFT